MRQLETLIPIASGASGRVYRTRDRDTGQVLAVKRLHHDDDAQLIRLRREAAAQQQLDHPNICRVFGLEQDERGHWQLLMEFIPGKSLAQEMDRIRLDARIDILIKVASAVEAAHAAGILHRDLKPSNILLRDSGEGMPTEPVVVDFGLARSDQDAALTTTGDILGTPAYMAPEQALGDRDRIGPATDVFALGCMLYEALTGQPPFEAATVSASLDRLLHSDPAHPRKLNPHAPEPLCRIALQCLERDPARRYAKAGALAQDLSSWHAGHTVQARHYSRLYRWRRAMARQPLLTALSFSGLALILTLAGWSAWQSRTAAAREALASELGTTLGDIENRMRIARLAPAHDINTDRQALSERLASIARDHGAGRFADLVQTRLARTYLSIGDIDRAETHARLASASGDSLAARAVRADVLLARYTEALVPIMALAPDQRSERLDAARERFLAPAEELFQSLEGSGLEPVDSLVQLAILERRFESATELIDRRPPDPDHGYERRLLIGRLALEKATQALESAERDAAADLFDQAREEFHAIAAIARSDPRPRLMACQAARNHLQATRHEAEELPETLLELEPLCVELDRVEPGRVSSHATQAAAYAGLAAAWDGINLKTQARQLIRQGIEASERGAALAPNDSTLLEFKSRLHLRLAGLLSDDFDTAMAGFDQAAEAARALIQVQPGRPVGPMLLGTIERDRARQLSLNDRDPKPAFATAADAFDQALSLAPTSPVVLGETALNEIFRFYELRSVDSSAAVDRAQRAIELQHRALELDPDNVDLLFDQGANHGDLWYHLALHPDVAPDIDRGALQQTALGLLARIRELAPGQPSGYTQPIMILLSDAEVLLGQQRPASVPIARALQLLDEASNNEIAIDRDLTSWVQMVRIRSHLLDGQNVASAIEDAWATMESSDVDRSEQFYRQLYRLELIGLEAHWRSLSDQPADLNRLRLGLDTFESLLSADRRQAVVLCHGARVIVHDALNHPDRQNRSQQLVRASTLFNECLAKDASLEPRFQREYELIARELEAGT